MKKKNTFQFDLFGMFEDQAAVEAADQQDLAAIFAKNPALNIAQDTGNSGTINSNEYQGENHARVTQSEGISGGSARSDNTNTDGNRAGKSLDAGLAGQGEGVDRSAGVSSGVRDAVGAGDRSGSELGAVQPSVELGEAGIDGVEKIAADSGLDHVIEVADEIGKGGLAKKFRENVAAIQIIKSLESEGRIATAVERRALARYVGFGALKGVFDPQNKQWAKQHEELKSLLNSEEFDSARASVLNAHFTSQTIVSAMYQAVEKMGFAGGRVLEPAMGSGNFFGMMPTEMRNASDLRGVELDLLTGRLAKALYPNAVISVATGFQDYAVPSGYFDMAIGNPPFGSEAIVDRERNPYSGLSIHNYFISRMIDKVRDGGIVPVVVSHSFMDANNAKAREWIAQRANLISAVRLPDTAFGENAGTEVVTDILFFQKTDTPELNPGWVNSSDMTVVNPKTGNEAVVSVNDYFQANKQNVLGRESAAGTMYRGDNYTVEATGELGEQLAAFVATIPSGIYQSITRTVEQLDSADSSVPDGIKPGSFYVSETGNIRQRGNDIAGERTSLEWLPKTESAKERMVGMIALRDKLRAQMRVERDSMAGQRDIDGNRQLLNAAYDGFVKKFGFVNSSTNRRIFLDDTEAALLQSLEFDYDSGIGRAKAEREGMEERKPSATKADILTRRVLFPPSNMIKVESAKDALLASLNAKGRVDLNYMAEAYGQEVDVILQELGNLIFVEPGTERVLTADEYLSGDVKSKLSHAKNFADKPEFQRNITALEGVIPADRLPSEIFASIGAGWIPAKVFEAYLKEIAGGEAKLAYVGATAQWLGEMTGGDVGKMSNDYGTNKINSFDLFKLMLNGRAPEIKKAIVRDGKDVYITDEEATEAARQRVDKIRTHWDSWVWSDGERATLLAGIFNEKHNRTVERKFDGSHITLPGATPTIGLRKHQKSVIWRAVQDRNVLMDHAVGAGKTFAMTAVAMEMKRLGISRKPLFVVPNHLTMQWRTEFARLYPAANVLAATPEDFSKDNRERLFSKIATGDYDAVIIGHSSLVKIGLDPVIEKRMYDGQISEIADAIEDMKRERGDRGIVRDMEKIKANLEAKVLDLVNKAGTKDKVVTFDELGIDGLFVDEMHEFKNLFFHTQKQRVSGLGNPKGSGKAFDLFMKVRWMQETYGEDVPFISATGTPVSNSLAEMFTMQRYMKYDELRRDGLHLFDAWARMYGEDEYVYEVAPSGVGYRISQRFSKFKNLPSLMGHYKSFADTITLDDLKEHAIERGERFPVPKLVGGKPQNIVAQRSEAQREYFGTPKVRRTDDGFGTDGLNRIVYSLNMDTAKIEQNEDGRWVLSDKSSSSYFEKKEDAELALVEKSLSPVLDLDPESLLGKFSNLKELTRASKGKINALSLTGLASKAGLDLRIINPHAADHPGSKINLAIGNMLRLHKAWEADKGAQLVFCDLSVPASARKAAASKEKRLYVMDESGLLTHKRGTLHTVEGREGFPFYLVRDGKGADAPYIIYEPVSGAKLRSGLADKSAAKEYVETLLAKEENRDKWFDVRAKYEPITAERIAEYRDAHDIEVEEDGNNEINTNDLEAISGASAFSVYDDIKAKLIANGVKESEIAFIHDFDTPSKKSDLFKRTNRGDVRFLLGSTPKLGAGTNVQERLVGLHHIDAPWRPSDLEQREGRIIRQGNKLYQRDPDNFEVFVGRYATEQTYDTRRWQLLEHKAAGIEQLRKYSGQIEIGDVDGEAANAADMKAAASGNPLILEETKLRTEIKRFTALRKAHADGKYSMQSKLNHERNRVESYLPERISLIEDVMTTAKANPVPMGKGEVPVVEIAGRKTTSRDVAEESIATLAKSVMGAMGHEKRTVRYRGVAFSLSCKGLFDGMLTLSAPTHDLFTYGPKDVVSASGMLTRFANYIDSLPDRKLDVESQIVKAKADIASIEARVNEPFSEQETLENVQREHAKVQRRLMKSTQIDAVAPEEREEFLLEMDERKKHLVRLGYGHALAEMEKDMVTVSTETQSKRSAVESDASLKQGNYHLAHKGGEDDEAYYSAGFDLDDETHEIIARDCSASAAHEIIHAHAKAKGFDTYEVNNNGVIRSVNKAEVKYRPQKSEDEGVTDIDGVAVKAVPNVVEPVSPSLANSVKNIKVTPQVISKRMADNIIQAAADSIDVLRLADVDRVIDETPVIYKLSMAQYIKDNRRDLADEVDSIMNETQVITHVEENTFPITEITASVTPEVKLAEAKDMLAGVADEFGGVISEWESSPAIGLWEYANLTIGDKTEPVGVSGGGVVSVNRHPFDPDGRVNDNIESIRAAIAVEFPVQAVTNEVDPLIGGIAGSDVDHIKTRMVEVMSFEVPEGSIVMNAPRPLLGTEILTGDFLTGRFYAIISLDDLMAENFIEENRKLDARMLVEVPREVQMEMVMGKYRDRYMEMDVDRRWESLSSKLHELRDLPYGELKAKVAEAEKVKGSADKAPVILDQVEREKLESLRVMLNRDGSDLDPTKSENYAQVMADAALQIKYQDVLDAFFQKRLLDVRKVLCGQGWNQMVDSSDMQKDGFELVSDFKWVGAGRNVIGVTYDFMDVKTGMVSDGEFIVDDLTKTPEQLAAHIDEKLHATQEKSVNFTPEIESTADKLKMAIANRVEIVVNLNNGQYRGVVSDVLDRHVVQNIGRGFVVVHDRALMNDDVVKDVKMDIRYRNGKPVIKIVESQSQEIVR